MNRRVYGLCLFLCRRPWVACVDMCPFVLILLSFDMAVNIKFPKVTIKSKVYHFTIYSYKIILINKLFVMHVHFGRGQIIQNNLKPGFDSLKPVSIRISVYDGVVALALARGSKSGLSGPHFSSIGLDPKPVN